MNTEQVKHLAKFYQKHNREIAKQNEKIKGIQLQYWNGTKWINAGDVWANEDVAWMSLGGGELKIMSDNVRESLCSKCIHRKTCKYMEEYQTILKKTDDIETEDYITITVKCCFYEERDMC